MTKGNPNNGNITKSWDIFKSDTRSFFIKEY